MSLRKLSFVLSWAVIVVFVLAVALLIGLAVASDDSERSASRNSEWIQTHIRPGLTRAQAYDLLRSRRLLAFNPDFVKGVSVGIGCEYRDQSGGNWPYKNEPVPRQTGACEAFRPSRSLANPAAYIDLGGAFFFPVCAWSTIVTLAFNGDDRVSSIQIGKPEQTCL